MALKLWSKLEEAGDVTAPQIGTGGAEYGSPTYEAAKFNNGILSDANSEGCTFPTATNSINLDKGTIEFWAKINFAPDDVASHWLFSFLNDSADGIRFFFDWAEDKFGVQVYSGSVLKISAFIIFSWDSGDLMHFGITWDREGNDIGGGKTLAVYINNVEKLSKTTTWLTGAVNANLYVGTKANQLSHSDAVIDNLKTHDVVKTDFSDKEDESAGANQAPTAPTSLEVDNKSIPTGANCVTITPQFSAIYNDPDAGDTSNAIQIQVGIASGLSDIWDSGWLADSTVDGDRCDAETYAGAALSIGTSYWWRCRFRDDGDAEGAWSEWQEFNVCSGREEQPGGPVPKSRPFAQKIKQPVRIPVEIQ